MELILGVDSGNTKTVAIVARQDGTIVGWGRAGCGDIYGAASEEDALGQIGRAADAALFMCSARREDLLSSGMSLAGADWPEDIAFLHDALQRRGLGRVVTVVNDGHGALRATVPQGPGIAVTCGTGLAIAARGCRGETWHGGFWLESHGAHEMALAAFRAAVRAELGIGQGTTLTERITQYHGDLSMESVLHRRTARHRTMLPPLDGLAPILLDEAEVGDGVSWSIVQEHGTAIGEYVLAAARQVSLGDTPFPLVLAGGVFRHPSKRLEDAILSRVRREYPHVRALRATFEPVIGALLFGFDASGITTDADVMSRMTKSAPPLQLFAT